MLVVGFLLVLANLMPIYQTFLLIHDLSPYFDQSSGTLDLLLLGFQISLFLPLRLSLPLFL